MPAGEYLINFSHKLWVKASTTSGSIPTSTSSMTQVFNLTDVSMTGASETTSVLDYDSDPTSDRAAVTRTSFSFPAVLNLSPGDPAYQLFLTAYRTATANGALQFWRQSAVIGGSTDDPEIFAGIATVQGFSEARGVGSVATVTMNLNGFGNNVWYPQGKGVATVTVSSAGSGLTPATYTAVPLTAVGIGGRNIVATVVVAGGGTVSAAPTITTKGNNVRVGDIYTCAVSAIGGAGVAPQFTVATVV